MKVWQANLMLVVVAIIWGVGFVATENAIGFLSTFQMQVFRFGIAAVVVTIVFFKKVKNASRQAVIYGSVIGIAFFLAMTFQTYGLRHTTVPKNAFITVTNVIWVPFIVFMLFKIKPKVHLLYGILVMLVGFFFLIFEVDIFNLQYSLTNLSKQMNLTIGDFLTLLCAIAYAAHIILGGKFVKDEDPITILIFQLYISTILSIIGSFIAPNESLFNMESSAVMAALPAFLFLAIFSSVISFALQLTAQQYVPPANTAIICSMESLFASLAAVVIGSEVLTSSLFISAVVITVGIIWAETGFKFNEDKDLEGA